MNYSTVIDYQAKCEFVADILNYDVDYITTIILGACTRGDD